jgi:Thioredoxin reductase
MTYDIIIIGAGPGGLTAGIYARSRMMKTLIIDASRVGGQLVSLYPDKGIHNYPGYERIQARKLSDKLYAQVESLECEVHEFERVSEIREGDGKLVVVTNKAEYETMSVVVAIGMGMFKPRKMGCAGEEEFEGKGLSYILPVKEELVGKKVTMFGGGNSAIEMALIADSVTQTKLVHRRNEFRADESNVEELKKSNVETIMNSEMKSVNGDSTVRSVTLTSDGKEFDIETDLVVINIGIASDLDDLKRWNLDLTKDGLIKVDFDMRTSRNGIFACGDVVDYEGKYKQIITACGEAATATNSAYKFVKKPYWA